MTFCIAFYESYLYTDYSMVFPTGQHMYTSIRNGCATISVSIGETSLQRSLRDRQDLFYFFQILNFLFIPVNEKRWTIKVSLKVHKSQIRNVPHFRKDNKSDKLLKACKFSDLRFTDLICGLPTTLVIK